MSAEPTMPRLDGCLDDVCASTGQCLDPGDCWASYYAPRYECECCEMSLCERKSPGIGYYCDTCMNHWCWAQDVGRPNARHATFAECDAEIKADHARLTAATS